MAKSTAKKSAAVARAELDAVKLANARAKAARETLEIVRDPKGDYAPALVAGVSSGLSALQESVDLLRSLAVGGKLTAHWLKICENSILLGGVCASLHKKGFAGDLLTEALRLRRLTGWTKACKGGDDYRTQLEESHFTNARSALSYYRKQLGLEASDKRGGARKGAGAKRKEETKTAAPDMGTVNEILERHGMAPIPDAPKETEILGPRTLVKPAVGEDFKLKVPAKTPKDAAHYFYNLEKGVRMTREANKVAFSQELVADVTEKILEQIARLHNAEDKLNS